MSFVEKIAEVAAQPNETMKKSLFMALLNRELQARGLPSASIVGGFAVELYSASGYMSKDVDIKGPQKAIEELLLEAGFRKNHGAYAHAELDIYIDWLGEGPQWPFEDASRFLDVLVKEPDFYVRVISYEDLILDRLMAAKFWRDENSRLWAEVVAKSRVESGQNLDWPYLEERAAAEDILDEVSALKAKTP